MVDMGEFLFATHLTYPATSCCNGFSRFRPTHPVRSGWATLPSGVTILTDVFRLPLGHTRARTKEESGMKVRTSARELLPTRAARFECLSSSCNERVAFSVTTGTLGRTEFLVTPSRAYAFAAAKHTVGARHRFSPPRQKITPSTTVPTIVSPILWMKGFVALRTDNCKIGVFHVAI